MMPLKNVSIKNTFALSLSERDDGEDYCCLDLASFFLFFHSW